MKALLYLELRQFINSLKNVLRSPRRLIPALIIAAWLVSTILGNLLILSGAAEGPRGGGLAQSAVPVAEIEAGIFLLLSLGMMLTVYQAFTTGFLVFSIAHIDFMFPAPISRRGVLLVKLVKDYLKYGFWVALFFVLLGAPAFAAVDVSVLPTGLIGIAGLTALLLMVVNVANTVNLVFTFGFERLKQAGLAVKVVLTGAVASMIGLGVYQYLLTGDSYASILWAVDSPLVNVVFAPARWCAGLVMVPLKGVTDEDLVRLLALWALAIGSFALLMSRRENIYEPSIGISVKYARRRQAISSGDYTGVRLEAFRERGVKRSSWVSIPPFGRGAVALCWKNLVSKYRMSSTHLIALLVAPLLLILIKHFVKTTMVLHFLPVILVYMVFLLSIMAAAEVRAELRYANILKPMPIAAWKVMLAQAVNASLYLGLGIAFFAGLMYVLLPETRGQLLLVSAVTAPFIGFACVSAAMIPSLLYPDTRDAAQNYIYNLVGFLLVSVATIPTIVLGVALLWIADLPAWIGLTAVCGANTIVGAAGISVAGSIFRRFDPTAE